MLPPPGTPVSGRLSAATRRPGAIAALRQLRIELHEHGIYAEISYDAGEPRLVISPTLTVWADRNGEFFTWGATFMEEPAESARAEEYRRSPVGSRRGLAPWVKAPSRHSRPA